MYRRTLPPLPHFIFLDQVGQCCQELGNYRSKESAHRFLQVEKFASFHPYWSDRCDQGLDVSTALKELDALVRGTINPVVFSITRSVQQAVMKKGIEIKIHLFRAKVGFGHYVRLFDATGCSHKNIVYDVKFASVL